MTDTKTASGNVTDRVCWGDKPIRAPALKLLVVTYAMVVALVSLPLHPLFWFFGFRGTIRKNGDTLSIGFSKQSFERS